MALSPPILALLEKVAHGKALTTTEIETIKNSGEEDEFVSKLDVAKLASSDREYYKKSGLL